MHAWGITNSITEYPKGGTRYRGKKLKTEEVKRVSSFFKNSLNFQLTSDTRQTSVGRYDARACLLLKTLSRAHTPDHSHLMGLSRFHHVELWQALKNVIHSLLTELCRMRLHSSDIIHSLLHPCQLTTCKQQQHFKNMMKLFIQQWLTHSNITWHISLKCCTRSSTDLIYFIMTWVLRH